MNDEFPTYNSCFTSPIYQIIKAERILTEALYYEKFVSKPVRKVIIAPNYKEIFNNPKRFEQQCSQNGIELYCNKKMLYGERGFPYDFRYASQWYSALSITDRIYHTFRTVDIDFIKDIINDFHGEYTPKGYEMQDC